MKKYTCKVPILCGIAIIAHQGEIIELDENQPETKALEALKQIEPLKPKK
jgi:hypothetical protein